MKMPPTRQLVATFVPPVTVLAVAGMVSMFFGISPRAITMDVAAIARIHPLAGILSNLGILLWCAAAAICFFAAISLRGAHSHGIRRFLLASALLSTYLLVDDLFQFHEALAPTYLGVRETTVYVALGVSVLVYLIAYRKIILRTHYLTLALAFAFLASSVVIDGILEPWLWRLGDWEYFFEDGLKWLGIASWCSYYAQTSHEFLIRYLPRHVDVANMDAHSSHR